MPAWAGPPYGTDDPDPTEPGHWEIYALVAGENHGGIVEGETGVEASYGAAPNLQLSAAVPMGFARDEKLDFATGDIRLSVKYRFFHDERLGISAATFPGISLPTGSSHFTAGRVTSFFPVWVQKEAGPWKLFGGGGYNLNPGPGNRNYWSGGVALTRVLNDRLTMGMEATRHGADAIDAHPQTSFGIGGTYHINGPYSLLVSTGPLFTDGQRRVDYHGYAAVGIAF